LLFRPLTSNGQISDLDEWFTTVKEEMVIEKEEMGNSVSSMNRFLPYRMTRYLLMSVISTGKIVFPLRMSNTTHLGEASSSFHVFISFFMTPFIERLLSRVSECLTSLSLTTFMLRFF
jgi:hypothetical protein